MARLRGTVHACEVATPVAIVPDCCPHTYLILCVNAVLWRVMLIVIGLPSSTVDADREKLDTLGMVSSVTVALAVMLLYLVPEMVALMLNVADMPTLLDPSVL